MKKLLRAMLIGDILFFGLLSLISPLFAVVLAILTILGQAIMLYMVHIKEKVDAESEKEYEEYK